MFMKMPRWLADAWRLTFGRRWVHDAFHIGIVPFSVLALLGKLSPTWVEYVERFDLLFHFILLGFAVESFLDWHRTRKQLRIAKQQQAAEPVKNVHLCKLDGTCCGSEYSSSSTG